MALRCRRDGLGIASALFDVTVTDRLVPEARVVLERR